MFELESDKYEEENRWDWKEARSMAIAIVVAFPIIFLIGDLVNAYELREIEQELQGKIDAGLCTIRQPCEYVTSAGCHIFKDGPDSEEPTIPSFTYRITQRIPAIVVNRSELTCYRNNAVRLKFVAMPGVRR